QRLLRDRHVGEHPHPDLATALHGAGHGTTGRFDLAGRHACALGGLQAELAERNGRAALRKARVAALELLAVLGSLRLQHCPVLTLQAVAGAALSAAGASADSSTTSGAWSKTSPLKIHTFTPITPYVVRASAVP